jgi:sec-independent protein translocase protein TatB
VFGLSFGEILVLVIVGIVVLGPRRLPEMMRTAGKYVAKVRRLSTDLRAQSGIDDLIKQEGLESEIQELRSLSRINVIDTLITPAAGAAAGAGAARVASPATPRLEAKATVPRSQPLRHREYPVTGPDSYGALADDIPPRAPSPSFASSAPREAAPAASPPAAADAASPAADAASPAADAASPAAAAPVAETAPSPEPAKEPAPVKESA